MIVLGRIVAPFGLHGWVKVHPFADDPDAWCHMPHWWLAAAAEAEPASWVRYKVEDAHVRANGLMVKFEGVTDRSAAEAIDGRYVGALREALPQTAIDEFYWADLVGLEVINTEGKRLGKVSGMLSTGAHEVLRVQDGEQERLLPFVAQVVKVVDTVRGVMNVEWSADW